MLQSRQNQQTAGPAPAGPDSSGPEVEPSTPASNAAAQEELEARGVDEEASALDLDGSAQGTGGQATAAPPGGGAGAGAPPEDAWWVPFVRALSPEAAALLDKGVLGLAGEAIDGAVEGGLGSIDMAIDPEGWATEMQTALVGAIDMFSGVLAGDPTCCCMLEDACNAFMDGALFLTQNLSPGAAAFNVIGGSIDTLLETFGSILSLDGVQAVLEGIGSFVQDIIDEVAEWDEGAAAELAAWLGVDSDGGVLGTLFTYAEEKLAEWSALLDDAVTGVAQIAALFPPVNALFELANAGVDVVTAAGWILANWGDPDLLTKAKEEFGEGWVLLLVQGIELLKVRFDEVNAWVLDNLVPLGAAMVGVGTLMAPIPGLNLVGGALVLMGQAAAVVGAIGFENLGGIWEAWDTFNAGVLQPFLDALNMIVPSPGLAIFGLISALPECYQGLLLDVMVTLWAGFASVAVPGLLTMGMGPAGLVLGGVVTEVMVGAVEGFRDIDVATKSQVLQNVAGLLSAEGFIEFGAGFVVGLLQGVLGELLGILMLAAGAVAAMFVPLALGFAAIMLALDNLGDRAHGRDGAGSGEGEEEAPEQADAPPVLEMPAAEGEEAAQPSSVEAIAAMLGGFWDGVLDTLGNLGEQIAQAIVSGILWAGEQAYTIGNWAGFLVGVIAFELLTTKFIGLLAKVDEIGTLLKGVASVVDAGAEALRPLWSGLEAAFAALGGAVDALSDIPGFAFLRTKVDELFAVLATWWDELMRWLGRRADDAPGTSPDAPDAPGTKPGAPDGDAPDGPDADPNKRPRDGQEDDGDPNLKRLAQVEAQKAWSEFAGANKMVPWSKEDDRLDDKHDRTERTGQDAGVKYDAEPLKEGAKRFEVEVVAKQDGLRGRATAGDGWVATDGSAQFVAPEDQSGANADHLEQLLDDYEAVWEALVNEDPRRAMESEADSAATAYAANARFYDEMVLTTTFSNWTEDEVLAQARIAPNEAKDERTLRRKPPFPKLFEEVSQKVFDDYMGAGLSADGWADQVKRSATELKLSFDWPSHYRVAEGQTSIRSELETWYTSPDRRESGADWAQRMESEILGNATKYRDPLLLPTLESARTALKSALDGGGHSGVTCEIMKSPVRLVLTSAGKADPDMVAAVGGNVVEFLQELSAGRDVGKVKASEFVANDTAQPHSWYWRHPTSNEEENKKFIKDRVRRNKDKSGGDHEWIPCAKVIDIVTSAQQAGDATKGGAWLSLQDNMRSRTSDLVFRPARDAVLDALLLEKLEAADGDVEALRESLKGSYVDDWPVSGHVGALYVEVDGKRTAQTANSEQFHQRLEAMWAFEKDPETYPDDILDYVQGTAEGGYHDAALWRGDLMAIIPKEFEEHAAMISSRYNDTGGSSWGSNLAEFAAEAGDRFMRVERGLEGATP